MLDTETAVTLLVGRPPCVAGTKGMALESLGLPGWGHHAKNEYVEIDSIVPRLSLTTRRLDDLAREWGAPAARVRRMRSRSRRSAGDFVMTDPRAADPLSASW